MHGAQVKRVVVVLGMHRSGTSLVTRALAAMGVRLGDRLLPPMAGVNAKGFWEDEDIQALDEEMLAALGGKKWFHVAPISADDVWRLHAQGFLERASALLREKVEENEAPFGFKDPRVAKLLPFWRDVFAHLGYELRYVLVVRHPASVAESLQRRDGFFHEHSHLLWLEHVLSSLGGSVGAHCVLVDYDLFMHEPDKQAQRMAERLGLELDQHALKEFLGDFLDPELQHTHFDLTALAADPTASQLVKEVYPLLLAIAQDNWGLDLLRERLPDWLNELERQRAAFVLLDHLLTCSVDMKKCLQEFESLLAERESALVTLGNLLADAQAELRGQTAETERLVQQEGELQKALTEREGAFVTLGNLLADAQAALRGQMAETERLVQQEDGLQKALAEGERAFGEIVTSRSWRITRPMRWLARILRGDMVGALDPLRRRGLIGVVRRAYIANTKSLFVESPRKPQVPTHPVAVIVPVYRGVEMTRRCIESAMPGVLAVADAYLLAINDGSPEDGMVDMLESLEAHWPGRFEVLHNERNLGFVLTVNRGIEVVAGYDVVLLNSDVVVPSDWLMRLRSEAYSRPDAGTVTPFSNNATICSFPFFLQENAAPYGLAVEQVDGVFRNVLLPCVEAPTGVGFCMYVRRACLDEVGVLDAQRFGRGYGEENDLCQRALKAGWVNLITPNVYAFHEGGVSFSTEKQALVERAMLVLSGLHPNYHADVAEFCRADPVGRHRITRHLQLLATLPRPKVLFVSHNLGGGVRQHLDELVAHLGDSVGGLLLTPSVERGIDLRVGLHAAADTLNFGEEDFPALLSVLQTAGVSCVHFHHTMGLPEKMLDLPKALDATWLITVHDYYWLNGNPTLTGEDGRYRGYSDQIDHSGYRLPDGVSPAHWRDKLSPWLEGAACVIFPSAATKSLFDDHFHIERAVIAAHIEPGRNVQSAQRPWCSARPLVIGVLGALGREKGADYLEALASVAKRLGLPYEFRLLGYSYRPLQGVVATGAYRPDELLGMIEREACGLIFFPALWPETYCYTLSYALASGLPIIAPNLGAFPERLSGRANSGLYEVGLSPEALLETLDRFVAGLDVCHMVSAPVWAGSMARTDFYDGVYMELLTSCQRSVSPEQAIPPEGVPELVWQPLPLPAGWREQCSRLLWRAYMHPSLYRVGRLVPARLRRAARTALSRRPMHDIVASSIETTQQLEPIRPREVESAPLEIQPKLETEGTAAAFRSFYETRPPSFQTAVDLFKGNWKSAFPSEVGVVAGQAPMFEDTRPAWVNRNLPGGIAGKSILELGPFEGYQTYLLERLGAASIESVEGNSVNFMKCLILKNVFGLQARYVFGDFVSHLERVQGLFDMSWASGVLYHQVEPLRLLQLLAKKSSAIYLWTHYYDAQRIEQLAGPDRALFIDVGHVMKGLDGFQCMHYQRSYDIPQYQFNIPTNWEGGNQAFAYWLEVEDIFAFLKSQGFHNINVHKFSDVHGLPCVSFLARR